MPNVTGKLLDAAESDIQRAGFDPDKIKIVGGGTLGVVVKSNWQVCAQAPASGQAVSSAPQLTVDRSCGDRATAAPTMSTKSEPTSEGPKASEPTSEGSKAEAALTVENSTDLAALLAAAENCSLTIQAFATRYRGRNIEFDGSISAMNKHGSSNTRYDIGVAPGDKGASSTIGPAFQFQNVNTTSDLHLVSNVPVSIGVGDKLHVVAQVGDYNSDQCLLLLTPVSTEIK